jgi:carboxymethylenebutenolidase
MCYDDEARPPVSPGAAGSARGEDTILTAADGNCFLAYAATPAQPSGAQVLVLPDVRGLHQFYKDLALRFAEAGITAVAIDYFGRTAGLTSRGESFEYMPHVQQITLTTVFADAAAALASMRGSPARFSVGFCLGGTLSFLCGTQNLGLDGVIGFYAGMARDMSGQGTLLDQAPRIRLPALGLFGGADQGIPPEQVEEFDRRLDDAGVEHELVVYPGAPHSFFDRRAVEFAHASADAWDRVLGFIKSRAERAAGQ